jgi:hypothetical protein
MYERNAIVLERYFGKKLGYNEANNLKSNYNNYCNLLDKISNLGAKVDVERKATAEFNQVSEELENIKQNQDKLYKREAKLEYNRNILFANIEEKPEDLNRVFEKLEEDIVKIQDSLLELRLSYVEILSKYQQKKDSLIESHKQKQEAEREYADSYRQTKETFENVDNGYIIYIKGINTEELKKIKKELIDVMTKNGEKEKVPFDPDVISKAAEFATDISKKEADILTYVFEKTGKLLDEIENKTFKPMRHNKWRKDATSELEFFNSEREYLVAFLDNERLSVMSGKKTHRKLMLEACKNLVQDVEQMNNLYELLLREEAGRSAKKAYKDLYNKDYLIEIEASEKEVEVQATKLNISAATLLNSNYWRLEGMRAVYQSFYNSVTEFYGKDLEEFELKPEEPKQEEVEEIEEDGEFELPRKKAVKKEEIEETEEQEDDEEEEVEEEKEQEPEPEKVEKQEKEEVKEEKAEEELSEAEKIFKALEEDDDDELINDVPSISFDNDDQEDDIKEYDLDRIYARVERMKFTDSGTVSKKIKLDDYEDDEEEEEPEVEEKEEIKEEKAPKVVKAKKEVKEKKVEEDKKEEPKKLSIKEIEEDLETEKIDLPKISKKSVEKVSKIEEIEEKPEPKSKAKIEIEEQEEEEEFEEQEEPVKDSSLKTMLDKEPVIPKYLDDDEDQEEYDTTDRIFEKIEPVKPNKKLVPDETIKIEKIPETLEPIINFGEEKNNYKQMINQIDELDDEKRSSLDDVGVDEELIEEQVLKDSDVSSERLFEQYAKAKETQETLNAAFTKLKDKKEKAEKKKGGLFGFGKRRK